MFALAHTHVSGEVGADAPQQRRRKRPLLWRSSVAMLTEEHINLLVSLATSESALFPLYHQKWAGRRNVAPPPLCSYLSYDTLCRLGPHSSDSAAGKGHIVRLCDSSRD